MKYVEVFQSYGFIPFFTFNHRVFQLALSGGVSAPPWPSFRGVPAVPAAQLGTFAGASVLPCTQRRAGFAVRQSRCTLVHRQVTGKGLCTPCSLQVLSNAVTPPSISQGVRVHLRRPLKAPNAPASGPLSNTTLPVTSDAPMLMDWHISLSLVS